MKRHKLWEGVGRAMLLLIMAMQLVSCKNPLSENFECVNVDAKNDKTSFTKEFDTATYGSSVLAFCSKDGNVSLYADSKDSCNLLSAAQNSGMRVHFDEVIFTLQEQSYIGKTPYSISYNCKKI